jgi:hypothetical protein
VRLALTEDRPGHYVLRSLVADVVPQRWIDNPDIDLNIPGPWWHSTDRFDSGHAIFFRGFKPSAEVLAWFTMPDECELLDIDQRSGYTSRVVVFSFPAVFDQVTKWRYPRYASGLFDVIGYPHTLYEFQRTVPSTVYNEDFDSLVDREGRYFVDFRTAQAELIHGVTDMNQRYRVHDAIAVRVVHPEGWLREIRVQPTHVAMNLGGIALRDDCYVLLDGSPEVRARTVAAGFHVTLPLPKHLPTEVRVVPLQSAQELDWAVFYNAEYPDPHNSLQVIVEREDVAGYPRMPVTDGPTVGPVEIASSSPSAVFAAELVAGTRGYIERVAHQVNRTYESGCYDACAVMIRRLIETLIIEVFEAKGIADRIRDSAGDYLTLRDLITKTLTEPSLGLTRNMKNALPELKDVGDKSAHSRYFNAVRDDIDKGTSHVRHAVQELLALANLK